MSQEQLHRPEAAVEETKVNDEGPAMTIPPGELIREDQDSKSSAGSPITYGDVFPATAEELSGEVVTTEDASLMQTAEAMAFGHTLKGGAASTLQSAAAKNVQGGFVERDAHSKVAEYGLSVSETSVPGATMDVEYVAGQPVFASAKPTPTDPAIASLDAVTIGEALEAAAVGGGDRPVDDADARAILSAEARATGHSMPTKGGVGATAQSAAQLNHNVEEGEKTTLADVLMDATSDLPLDKAVTYEDAYKVLQAELRGRNVDELRAGGVGATLVAAADLNQLSGLVPPPGFIGGAEDQMDLEAEEKEDASIADELLKYQPLKSTQSEDLTKQTGTAEETIPLVKNSDEEIPSLGSEKVSVPKQPESEDLTKQAGKEEAPTPLVENSDEKVPSLGSEEVPTPKQPETFIN